MKRYKLLPKEYASFRPEIVSYFASQVLPGSRIIFDPMAGTSPLIPYVEHLGLKAYFNDLLPIYFYLNRAKTYTVFKKIKSIQSKDSKFLENELLKCLNKLRNKKLLMSENWIHESILAGLIEAWQQSNRYEKIVSWFFKAVILLCVRPYSSISPSKKNATWNKPGGMSTGETTREIVKERIEKFLCYYKNSYENFKTIRGGECIFMTEDASVLHLPEKPDVILTSPAYANRYDYATMYAPELYFLSKADHQTDLKILKKNILASNAVEDYSNLQEDLGNISLRSPMTHAFLMEVEDKGMARENKYYLRYYSKYYSGLFRILDNVVRLLRKNGKLYIVVQNNIHRGEVNYMGDFLKDYFLKYGLKVETVFNQLKPHQGRRNISANYPLVLKKHIESIIEVGK
jgi:hypothetical protein